jgi:hypothetical protein
MAYSLQPTSREQTLARTQSAKRHRALFALITLAGIAVIIGLSRFIDDVTPAIGWTLFAIGLGLTEAGLIGAHLALKKMRYSITIGTIRREIGRAVTLISIPTFAWAIGIPLQSVRLELIRFGLVLLLALQAVSISLNTTLFDGDAEGLRFGRRGWLLRRARVAWDDIVQVVFTTGRPGSIELGLRLRSTPPAKPMAVQPSEVLTDLPYRIVVPQKSFDLTGLKWLLNQSGRHDIALLHRTATGEQELGCSNNWR